MSGWRSPQLCTALAPPDQAGPLAVQDAAVAAAADTPTDVLVDLAATRSLDVAAVVADRDDLGDRPGRLHRLLLQRHRDNARVWLGVVLTENPACPAAVLDRLAADHHPSWMYGHPLGDLSACPADQVPWGALRCWALPRLSDPVTLAGLAGTWTSTAGQLLSTSATLAA